MNLTMVFSSYLSRELISFFFTFILSDFLLRSSKEARKFLLYGLLSSTLPNNALTSQFLRKMIFDQKICVSCPQTHGSQCVFMFLLKIYLTT